MATRRRLNVGRQILNELELAAQQNEEYGDETSLKANSHHIVCRDGRV